MPLHDVKIGENLGLHRGDAAVCIPVFGAYDLFAQCLLSVVTHTPPDVPVLVCDDATPDPRLRSLLEDAIRGRKAPHEVFYLRQPRNVGFVENINAGMTAAAPADVVILNSDCVVFEGWFASLRAAACSESRVATATALTNAGTIVSIPYRNTPVARLPDGRAPDRVASEIRRASLRLRPDIPTCIGHCVYIRRDALELVGLFDTDFSPGYEEEVDFSQRCVLHGLRHVVADDVFVLHRHAGSFGSTDELTQLRDQHHGVIAHRYPYYDRWCEQVALDDDSQLARSLSIAAGAVRGTSVTIDGRILTHSWTGAQLVALRVIAAVDEFADVRVRVLVSDDLGARAKEFLKERPHIELIGPTELERGVERTDVVHRPYQVSSLEDLGVLRAVGRRIVLTQLDHIALRNPVHFRGFEQWRDHWRLNRMALAAADQVVFLSRHGAEDALALGFVTEDRVNVVAPEIDDVDLDSELPSRAPSHAGSLAQRPFLLCLGADYLHKNRVFAMRLLEALVENEGFDGTLVLAGPKMKTGSSAGEEAAYLLARPAVSERVVDLGAVDEAGKRWLLETAVAVVYPTTYEGFGLIPFEAARAGTPCLFAPQTSLAEVLPQAAGVLVPWDPQESAKRAAPVLVEGEARDQLVDEIEGAGARFTSASNGLGLQAVYEKALRSPPRETFWSALAECQREIDRVRDEGAELRAIVEDPLNRGLVGPDAVLPAHLRRPVLAVATRPALRTAADLLYRAARALRPGGGEPR
jgi:GT2 family glycosyltransferase/glycosyltransferase involved in cell wall biosynthesis